MDSERSENNSQQEGVKELMNTPLFQEVRDFFEELKGMLQGNSHEYQRFKQLCVLNSESENYEESLTGIFRLLNHHKAFQTKFVDFLPQEFKDRVITEFDSKKMMD